jgi:hypothetical protein
VGERYHPVQNHGFQLRHADEAETGQGGLLAVGVNFFSDNAGDAKLKSSQGGLSVAYHIKTGQNSTIGAGLFGGFGQRSIDPSGLQWGEQYDGSAYDAALANGRIARCLRRSPSLTWALAARGTTTAGLGANDVVANQSTQATIGFGYFHVTRPASYTFLGC